MSKARWREGPDNSLGVQNLREAKDVMSEKHIEKLVESRWLALGCSLGDRGHSQLDTRLLDAVKRIRKEYQNEVFGVGEAFPLLAEILAEPFSPKLNSQTWTDMMKNWSQKPPSKLSHNNVADINNLVESSLPSWLD